MLFIEYNMRISTDAAAIALGVERRVIDNILAREAKKHLPEGRRGRRRQVPIRVLELVAISLVLQRDAGVPIARGLQIAEHLQHAPRSPVPIGSLAALSFDLARLRSALATAVDQTLETVTEPARGRPAGRPQSEAGRLV
jgi:hypothetical protein